MVIEINKDIDRYQESVALGLNAKQLIFSAASLICGAGLILCLYRYIGLTASAYVAIPVVAPIALGGFYSYHGMSFYEVMGRKLRFAFFNRPLVYCSTEGEAVIQEYEKELLEQEKKRILNSKKQEKKSKKIQVKKQKRRHLKDEKENEKHRNGRHCSSSDCYSRKVFL